MAKEKLPALQQEECDFESQKNMFFKLEPHTLD